MFQVNYYSTYSKKNGYTTVLPLGSIVHRKRPTYVKVVLNVIH
jgi:hypothetical protein